MHQTQTSLINSITWLAKLANPYPTSINRVRAVAQRWNFNEEISQLLRRFPTGTFFVNADDLMTRCEDLALLHQEKQAMPDEAMRSPEG